MEVRTVVTTIIAVTIGVMLTCTLLIPTAQEQISGLESAGFGNWASMVELVVLVTLISLVVVALYSYTK